MSATTDCLFFFLISSRALFNENEQLHSKLCSPFLSSELLLRQSEKDKQKILLLVFVSAQLWKCRKLVMLYAKNTKLKTPFPGLKLLLLLSALTCKSVILFFFLYNCRNNVTHECPKCKQTNMKLLHPQVSYYFQQILITYQMRGMET